MSDQLQDLVSKMVAAGESEDDIALVIQQYPKSASAVARPIATGGGRGTGLDVRKSNQWASDNAPTIGAAIATAGTGGAALPLQMLAAGAGGALGAGLRGDSASDAMSSGALQGALQGVGGGAVKVIGGLARRVYNAAIPKAVQDKFSMSDLARQGLDSRVLMGTKHGTATAATAKAEAGQGVQNAANTAPDITAQDVQAAFRPKYNRALTAGKVDRANQINAHVRQSMQEIGPRPMNGVSQLARKEILEQEGKSAMQAANPNMASVDPQLANIERKAIVSNLRRSKPMADALNKSQASIGVERAARATENSSLVNRLSHGGIWNAGRSPAALSGAGIALNESKRAVSPEMLRLLSLIMGDSDE